MTRRELLISLFCLFTLSAWSQKMVVSGKVTDIETGRLLPLANVSVAEGHTTVVTNDEGFFTLKCDSMPSSITVSHIGYQTSQMPLKGREPAVLSIRLKPSSVRLQEILVWTGNPRQLVELAMSKIPANYGVSAERYNCFYRETAMKRQHYIYVAEGVVDMYKTGYDRQNTHRDRVAIIKGRRLLSPKQDDTLAVKVIGGPVLPIQLDVVKNQDFLLNDEELANYAFTMLPPTTIGSRLQFVVAMEPACEREYALYHGRLYIDHETLAFTRAELSLDMENRTKATNYMLVRKPAGVRFRPKELSTLIDYRLDNGVTRINYIRSTFRFNCDWRRRLFATSYVATCEMVVTEHLEKTGLPISSRSSFDRHDAFFDRVDYFRDPLFWSDYNIIEPTETLDTAIGRLIKKHQRK